MSTSTMVALILASATSVAIIIAGRYYTKHKPPIPVKPPTPRMSHPARRAVVEARADRATKADMDWLGCNLLMDAALWDAAIDFEQACRRNH